MTGLWNDFNSAQDNANLIPKGTLARVRLTIRPGGFDDPAQGWTGGYATRGASGAVYLSGEFTVARGALRAAQDLHADRALQPQGSGLGQHGPQPHPRHAELGARHLRQGRLAAGAGGAAHRRLRRSRRARVPGAHRCRRRHQRRRQERDPERRHAGPPRLRPGDGRRADRHRRAHPAEPCAGAAVSARPPAFPAVPPGRSRSRPPVRLRPRQTTFVERSLAALHAHGNTLGIAPTGAGKTIMLSAVAGQLIGDSAAKACVLAHRDELTAQNRDKFARVNPEITTSVVDAGTKDWAGQVTFAMVPTLARAANLAAMPALDLLVIDEAHHAVADSYRRIIDRARGDQSRLPHLRRHRHAEPRRPQGPARGLRQRRRPGPAGRADRLRSSRAAAHLRHRRRRAGEAARRSARPPPTSTWSRSRGS